MDKMELQDAVDMLVEEKVGFAGTRTEWAACLEEFMKAKGIRPYRTKGNKPFWTTHAIGQAIGRRIGDTLMVSGKEPHGLEIIGRKTDVLKTREKLVEAGEEEIASLNKELKEERDRTYWQTNIASMLEAQLEQVKGHNDQYRCRVDQLLNELNALKTSAEMVPKPGEFDEQAQYRIGWLEAELAQTKSISEAHIAGYKAEAEKASAQLAQLEKKLVDSQANCTDERLVREINRLNKENAELKEMLMKEKEMLVKEAADSIAMGGAIDQLTAQLNAAQSYNHFANGRISKLQMRLRELANILKTVVLAGNMANDTFRRYSVEDGRIKA